MPSASRGLLPLALVGLAACADCGDDPDSPGVDAGEDGVVDAATDSPARWPGGRVDVVVVDEDGAPVVGAFVLTGGSLEWETTDADGRAVVEVGDDGVTDRWVVAAKRGWRNSGVDLDDFGAPAGPVTIELRSLPETDNPAYAFGEGGTSESPNTLQCGHCHRTIADQWNLSRHHGALENPRARDLYNGSASLAPDEAACDGLGGRWLESRLAGADAGTEERCYVERGVLPDLNDGCGGPGELPCDHREIPQGTLANLGRCGDCHGAAIPGARPGSVDLNDAVGITFAEGISCDLCHKVAEVTVGPAPGLDGALRLLRPGKPSPSGMTEYEPIMFGPYPDVLNPFMGASYQPQFRTGELCSGCHEFAQEPLRPDESTLLDRDRWPDGIPVHTTWSEWAASDYSPGAPCPTCHMPPLDEDTAIGNLSEGSMGPGLAAGWLRAPGEIRSHGFVGPDTIGADAASLELSLSDKDGIAEATVTVANLGAGHAFPTGEPLRQIAVLLSATLDGAPVDAVGGRAIPDVGGSLDVGTVGEDVVIAAPDRLVFTGRSLDGFDDLEIRVVRTTGEWDDYAGPGVGWFADGSRTPEEKGLPIDALVERISVESSAGEAVTLAWDATLEAGDRVYLVTGEDQWAGAAGALYAKILVDAQGLRGVPHYRAVDVASDNRIAAGAEARSTHLFPAPVAGQVLEVTARIVYRRAPESIARVHGWPLEDLVLGTVSRRLER